MKTIRNTLYVALTGYMILSSFSLTIGSTLSHAQDHDSKAVFYVR